MANTPDVNECAACRRQGDARLPIDPWRSLAVHFGMLLGVDDFQTIDAYHRGKMWLHSAWLHREGVVWGLAPSLAEIAGELRIEPGLAIDACGRELHLDRPACIDLGKWFAARAEALLGERAGDVVVERHADGSVTIDAHVRMRFVGCLDRQVPALAEPCDGAGRTTAYSRTYETVELELVPGSPDEQKPYYPRLRKLFGLDEPSSDPDVLDARTQIAAMPLGDQPAGFERAFRRFAALDAADLHPAKLDDGTLTLLPAIDPAAFVLARLQGLSFKLEGGDWRFDSLTELDWYLRPTHVATRPLEDLLAATLAGLVAPAAGSDDGPRVLRGSLVFDKEQTSFSVDKPLEPNSLAGNFSLAAYTVANGWKAMATVASLSGDGLTVTLKHAEVPADVTFERLVIDGTSSTPLFGINGWPLAGADDGSPTANHAGRDFAHMQRKGS